jgi:hypothetical protein
VQGDTGLHVDQRHVVGDGVVQLSGDEQPLLVGLPPLGLSTGLPRGDGALTAYPEDLAGAKDHECPCAHAEGLTPRPALVADQGA